MSSEIDTESETSRNVEGAESVDVLEPSSSGNCQTDNENEQTEDERLSEKVFSIPLILKGILKHLGKSDLLRTALVDKNWNIFSREVLRKNQKCLAIVEGNDFCDNLKNLNALLLNSETVPFNGISTGLPCSADQNDQGTIPPDLPELMNNILRKIHLKYLSLQLHDGDYLNCTALEFIRKIIGEQKDGLEGLRLDARSFSRKCTFSELIGLDLRSQWLRNIRSLQIFQDFEEGNLPGCIVKELVEASPQLRRLYGDIDVNCLKFILPLKAARVVKEFDFRPTRKSLKNCKAFCLDNPQLEILSFSTSDSSLRGMLDGWSKASQKRVARILKQLLIGSQDSLRTFACGHYDLVVLTLKWNLPVLRKLSQLSIVYSRYFDHSEAYPNLRKIEWTKYFPNLKEVWVITDYNIGYDFFDSLDFPEFQEPNEEYVCESVTTFRWMWLDPRNIQVFKSVFPNVRDFHFTGCQDWEFPTVLNELWTAWPDLELIHGLIRITETVANFDSVFLGISVEEAAYLLENVELLEPLQIVSTKPCLFNLRKLKKFVIHVSHDEDLCHGTRPSSDQAFVSRLSGQCVFARVPGLVVKIYRDLCEPMESCQFALRHIKPFAECVE